MDFEETKIGRFDQVKLLTTKNVTYLSAPPETIISPDGIWTVAGAIHDNLLLTKNNIIIRIPVTDVLKVFSYTLENTLAQLGKLSHGKRSQRKTTDTKESK